MITLQEPYAPRPVRFLELWEDNGWRLKLYGLAYQTPAIRPELVPLAKDLARSRLRQSAGGWPHYQVGFVGIHDGRGAVFIFVDFWADENELHHHVYVAPKDDLRQMEYVTPSGRSACFWDLNLQAFERQAWIDSILANPAGPDVEQYLATRLNADV